MPAGMQTLGTRYFRPVPCPPSVPGARSLAGGLFGFRSVEVLARGAEPQVLPVDAMAEIDEASVLPLSRAAEARTPILGLDLSRPRIMGVLNVTDDSFSDGGRFADAGPAVAHALEMAEAGADLVDIGGESTRPGAEPVPAQQEIDRVLPVIEALVAGGLKLPISIDTRNAAVAKAALDAGARLFNDVSALTHDPESPLVARRAGAVCLMHAQGDPQTMQRNPSYDDVLLDVYEHLAARVASVAAAGIDRSRVLIDPGIGFGKTMAHNLALIRRLSLFHTLGCAVLLGVSRKRFIGTLSGVEEASRRVAGSVAAGLAGLAEGVQMLRVHDVAETVQAVRVWQAIEEAR